MKIMNKKSRAVMALLLVSISFWGQDIYKLCGAWKTMHDIVIKYRKNGDTFKMNTKLGNDFATTILYKDGKGYVIPPNKTVPEDSFTWKISNNKFIYHESDSCPWYDTLKYEILYGTKYDTLRFEEIYKRKSFRYIELYRRKKIKLAASTESLGTFPTNKNKISYFAYRKRIILDQRPALSYGNYDEKNSTLYLEDTFLACIKEARGFDSFELFVVDNSMQNTSIVTSFVIEYGLDADTIKDIFLTNKYYTRWRN